MSDDGVATVEPREERPHRPLSPFARLVRTHGLLMAGDALVAMALAGSLFFSISPTAARGRVALSLVLTMAPFAVVAPFLGTAIDRTTRGRRIIASLTGAGRAVAALLMVPVLDGLLLFPAAFTMLVLSKAYAVAKSSLVPSAVHSDGELVEANAKLAMTGAIAGFLAGIPGVPLLRYAGAEWVLRLAAVMFAAGAVASLRLVEHRREAGPRDDLGEAELRTAGIVRAAVVTSLLRASVGFLTFLVAFDFRRPPSAPAWWFGVVLAASLGANLAGAALAPRLRALVREEWLLTCSVGAVGTFGLLLARAPATGTGSLLLATAMAAVVAVAAAVGKLAFDAIVQRDAPDAGRGRAFARFEALFQLVWVVGALVPVVVTTPLRIGVGIVGAACVVAAVGYPVARLQARRRSGVLT